MGMCVCIWLFSKKHVVVASHFFYFWHEFFFRLLLFHRDWYIKQTHKRDYSTVYLFAWQLCDTPFTFPKKKKNLLSSCIHRHHTVVVFVAVVSLKSSSSLHIYWWTWWCHDGVYVWVSVYCVRQFVHRIIHCVVVLYSLIHSVGNVWTREYFTLCIRRRKKRKKKHLQFNSNWSRTARALFYY